MESDEELRKKAQKRAEEKVSFYIHLSVYIMVNLLLIVLWWINGGVSTFPWFIFPLIGWGIGLVAHGVGVFAGSSYVDKLAQKEFEKLKNQR